MKRGWSLKKVFQVIQTFLWFESKSPAVIAHAGFKTEKLNPFLRWLRKIKLCVFWWVDEEVTLVPVLAMVAFFIAKDSQGHHLDEHFHHEECEEKYLDIHDKRKNVNFIIITNTEEHFDYL